MEPVLYVGLGALAVSVPLVLVGARRAKATATAQRETVRYLGQDGFVTVPAGRAASPSRIFAGIGRRLSPRSYLAGLRERLAKAGDRRSVEQFLALKGMGFACGVTFGIVVTMSSPGAGIPLGTLVAALGLFAPDVLLRRRIDSRSEAIRRTLPEALDLMAISVEAGVGLEGAMKRAVEDIGGPLGEEFGRMLHDMQLGATRREAFQGLRDRVEVSELSAFVLALLQAETLGVAIGRVLTTQAAEMRRKRRQRAHERAAKTPVKILFPLVFGIFPALLIVVLGPAVIRIMGSLILN
jgi:tight adherence protein C